MLIGYLVVDIECLIGPAQLVIEGPLDGGLPVGGLFTRDSEGDLEFCLP